MSEEKNQELADHVEKNKAMWEATSDTYEQEHAKALEGKNALAWGLWRIPEAELRVLGNVAGKDILEFGCGAARWSIALAQFGYWWRSQKVGKDTTNKAIFLFSVGNSNHLSCLRKLEHPFKSRLRHQYQFGARPIGIDISSHQLAHARRLMTEAGVNFPLIECSAEAVPLPDASFDMVFCDWGAMTFCDPYHTVPEATRLLRPGGLFAFSCATPMQVICTDVKTDRIERHLVNDYFSLRRLEWPDSVDFQLPYGEWIRLFRRNGLVIEDLIETRPAPGATSTYRSEEESEWARHWPMENIWRLRKAAL